MSLSRFDEQNQTDEQTKMKTTLARIVLIIQTFLKHAVYKPKDCNDLKERRGIEEDGEYKLYPPLMYNQSVFIYCYNMRNTPKSFITLSNPNIMKHPDLYCDKPPPGPLPFRPARTVYTKIAILMDTMEILIHDQTFAKTTGSAPIPYGVARDCFVAHRKGKRNRCGVVGAFFIDLRYTNFILADKTSWKPFGKSPYQKVKMSTRQFFMGRCGGFCGGCKPNGKLFIQKHRVHGYWSSWQVNDVVRCSATCGNGTRRVRRLRRCNNPPPIRGGRRCRGKPVSILIEICSKPACPVDGGWSSWSETHRGDCSVTCDGPGSLQITMSRTCTNPLPKYGGKSCEGSDLSTKTQTCDPNVDCPVDGAWSSWVQHNGDCSATCESGVRSVTLNRTCTNPKPQFNGKPCEGEERNILTEVCEVNVQCPVDGGWSSWSETRRGDCSVTCDGPGSLQITLSRTCTNPSPKHGGKSCEGSDLSTMTETCDLHVVCSVDGAWSSWVQHNGDCSVTCESGVRSVTLNRTCTNPKPQFNGKPCEGEERNILTEVCEVNVQCPVHEGWSSWSETHRGDCSVTCDGPGSLQITLSRTCTNPSPKHGRKSCEGSDLITKTQTCDLHVHCPVDGAWSSWVQHNGDCSVTCESGVRSVTLDRTCTNPKPQFNGKPCEGEERNILTEVCEVNVQCPVDGQWSNWTVLEAGVCSAVCRRSLIFERKCDNPEPQHGGNHCQGRNQKTMTEKCMGDNCTDGTWASWFVFVTGNCTRLCMRNVTLRRTCTKPVPGAVDCNGSSETNFTETCSGGSCVSDNNQLHLILAIISLFVLLVSASVAYTVYRRFNEKKNQELKLVDYDQSLQEEIADSATLDRSAMSMPTDVAWRNGRENRGGTFDSRGLKEKPNAEDLDTITLEEEDPVILA